MDCKEYVTRGIAKNNARAMRSRADFPKWIPFRSIPTGTQYQEQIATPKSAKTFLFEYAMFSWPVGPGAFRPLFVEVYDNKGETYVLVDFKKPQTSTGAKITLFSSPGVDIDPATAGDQSFFRGMFYLGEEFPGNSIITLNIFGALATPDPAFVDILLAGRVRTKAFYGP